MLTHTDARCAALLRFPHNYEVTAFEAYLDMYVLTGNSTYLEAMHGAWDLFMQHWIRK